MAMRSLAFHYRRALERERRGASATRLARFAFQSRRLPFFACLGHPFRVAGAMLHFARAVFCLARLLSCRWRRLLEEVHFRRSSVSGEVFLLAGEPTQTVVVEVVVVEVLLVEVRL